MSILIFTHFNSRFLISIHPNTHVFNLRSTKLHTKLCAYFCAPGFVVVFAPRSEGASPVGMAFPKSCVVAPSRGPRDTADSRLHRLKGPHRLEAWRSGAKEAIALETKPGTKPGTNNLEIKLGTKLATSARPQDTAACRPHAPLSKLHIWGWGGGWGLGCSWAARATSRRRSTKACAA